MSIGAHGSGSGAAGKVWYLGGRQTSLILRDWSAGAWVFQGFTRRPSPFEGPAFSEASSEQPQRSEPGTFCTVLAPEQTSATFWRTLVQHTLAWL